MEDTAENKREDGIQDYVQTISYYPAPKHTGQEIKCVLTHNAFSEIQLEQNANEAEKRLEILCKPGFKVLLKFRNLHFS